MPNQPLITAIVKITARDINNNNVQKTFSQVKQLIFDYTDGTVNVVDVTGSFYFSLIAITTLTYTIVANPGGSHNVVAS